MFGNGGKGEVTRESLMLVLPLQCNDIDAPGIGWSLHAAAHVVTGPLPLRSGRGSRQGVGMPEWSCVCGWCLRSRMTNQAEQIGRIKLVTGRRLHLEQRAVNIENNMGNFVPRRVR
jgi:hypothetical protein